MDHTADAGFDVTAPDLPGLYAEAARGLLGLLVAHPEAVRTGSDGLRGRPPTLKLTAPDREALMVDWLEELLYRFQVERWVTAAAAVVVRGPAHGGWQLAAILAGEPFDPDRHGRQQEVKAVTYHDLCVEPTADGWRARVILDI